MNQPRLLRFLLTGLPAGLILTGIIAVLLHVRSQPTQPVVDSAPAPFVR
jgi:hypothetical protein